MNAEFVSQSDSLHIGDDSGEDGIIENGLFYSIFRNSNILSGDSGNSSFAYKAAFLSLIVAIFSVTHIFWCLRELSSPQTGAGGSYKRMLALAEVGSLKKCIDGDSTRVAGAPPISPLHTGSTRSEESSGRNTFAVDGTNLNEGYRQDHQPLHTVQAWWQRSRRPEKPTLFLVIDALENVPDDTEYMRLQQSLILPSSGTKNLTVEEKNLIKEANDKLAYMLKERSRLANSLRRKLEKRERLIAYELDLTNRKVRPVGVLGRLRKLIIPALLYAVRRRVETLTTEIRKVEENLKIYRSALKGMLSRRQQMALSLRLLARSRQNTGAMTIKEANALSAAKLIMHGHRRRNYVPTFSEGLEILKMGSELSEALHDAELLLSKLLRRVASNSGSGDCPSCKILKTHMMKCTDLQREAELYALQLRSVLKTFPPDKCREVAKNVEGGSLQLRRKMEMALQLIHD